MIALLRPLFHLLMRDGTYCPECYRSTGKESPNV